MTDLGAFGLVVANRISSTNACPHRSSTTPRIRSTSTTMSVPRVLQPTRRATLPPVHSRTRPRRRCKHSLSSIRRILHPRIMLILGMKLDRVSARILHGAELWFLARRPGRRARVVLACASARLRIRMRSLKDLGRGQGDESSEVGGLLLMLKGDRYLAFGTGWVGSCYLQI
jgi:hypothetical protein